MEEEPKKRVLVICYDERLKRHAMNRLYDFMGKAAKVNLTEGIIETRTSIYYFRTPVKEKIIGYEVSEIIFDVGVLPEDIKMVQSCVRIRE